MKEYSFKNLMSSSDTVARKLQKDIKTYGKTAFDEGFSMGLAAGEARTEERLKPRHGEWVTEPYSSGRTLCRCSACGLEMITFPDFIKKHLYCYRCGAKMDGKK